MERAQYGWRMRMVDTDGFCAGSGTYANSGKRHA